MQLKNTSDSQIHCPSRPVSSRFAWFHARSAIFGDANRRDGAEPAWHGAARLNENPSRLRATELFLAPIKFINCAIRPSLQIEPLVKLRILVNLACHADDKERGANNASRSS